MTGRALVFDPYLASMGGGERVALGVASRIADRMPVDVGTPTVVGRRDLARMGMPAELPLRRLSTRQFPLATRHYDLVVAVTNHLPTRSFCRRSHLIVQFPFPIDARRHPVRAASRGSILRTWRCLAYSQFVRGWIGERWGVDADILQPPIDLGTADLARKEPIIVSVGRFFPSQHSKRQDALVEAFRLLPPSIRDRWTLVLAGGVADDAAAAEFAASVRERAVGLRVEVRPSMDQASLRDLLARATLFWHATGFGRSPAEPERAEHFGMSTVEAMSFGAVPLVFDDGGQAEIVRPDFGVRWRTLAELKDATVVLTEDPNRCRRMARAAAAASRQYGRDAFLTSIDRALGW